MNPAGEHPTSPSRGFPETVPVRRLADSHQLMRCQHQSLLEMLPVPVVTTDAAGLIRSANAAAASLFGVGSLRLLRKPIYAFVSLEDRPELRRRVPALVPGQRLRSAITLLRRDGRAVAVEANAVLGAGEIDISWFFLAAAGDRLEATTDIVLSAALVELARLPVTTVEAVEVLRQARTVCQDALGDRVAVSLNCGPPSAPTAVSSSLQLAQAADGAQISLGEGPCVTAFEERRTVVSSYLHSDERWPHFAADPRTRGVGGAIATPMVVGGELLGAVTVYGDVGDPPEARLVEAVELLAAAVAAALYELRVRHELELTAADMERALVSRATIDQAKGIVMADRGCTADEAFEHLVELSSTQHVKLRELARQIVDQRSVPLPRRPGQFGGRRS